MAEIKAFRALRFTDKAGKPCELCCPPYDIISESEKQDYLALNPHNVIKLELPGTAESDYAAAGKTLEEWLSDGIVKQDDRDAIYVYEEEFSVAGNKYSMRGIVCRVKLYEFSENVVLPHEETLSKAKEDRFRLMTATGCNFSQIYSLYHDENHVTSRTIKELSDGKPEAEFCDAAGVTHRLWTITDSGKTAEITEQFRKRKLYIADGHHRYETALRYKNSVGGAGDSDYVMMFLIDMENEGLVVFPTHRIVRGVKGFDSAALVSSCEKDFSVEKLSGKSEISQRLRACYDAHKKSFGFYDGKAAYLLTLKDISSMNDALPEASAALKGLDVSVLHSLILEKLLKIDKANMANQVNLTYTRDEKEAFSAAESDADACFILNPTRIDEIAAVAAAGEKMPQKSTYFYPKLITGLVMNKII